MSPRMGVITTGIALSLSIIMTVAVTSTNTLADLNIGAWTGSASSTQSFTGEVAETATCGISNGNEVSISFVDSEGAAAGSLDASASLENCQTTVDGTTTAVISEPTSEV